MQKTKKYTGNICINVIFGTIKEFKAVGAKKLQVEFEAAVPEASKASLTFKRGNSVVAGTAVWDAENKVATFTSNSILTQGKYTASMEGVNSKEADVEAEKVADIVINGDKDNILTGTSDTAKKDNRSNDEAYIYYDIVNQYGESIRERTTVNWSITSCDTNRENKSLGLVVAHRKDEKEIFLYGTQLSITAVCIKDNVPVTKTKVVKIGEQQAIDEVVYKGFVKKSQKGKKIDDKDVKTDVPADFAKDTWALLYQAKDQHGNLLEAARDNLGTGPAGAKIAMISGQPTYIENKFEDGGIYSVTSDEGNRTTEYSSATIEPGTYIDRGESINITAISTRTGKKTDGKFGIGKTKRLKSFQIETPSRVVADGDVGVVLPYTALDMDGNPVEDYKTIVRSSNKISLTASDGTLELREANDGKAVLTWSDNDKYRSLDSTIKENRYTGKQVPYNPYANSAITINDGVDRAISLTAVVTGEESSSKTTNLAVSDMRRPASIEDVHFGNNNNDTVIGGYNSSNSNIDNIDTGVSIIDGIDYNDQYGVPLERHQKYYFWNAARLGYIKGYNYSIGVRQLSGNDSVDMIGRNSSNSINGSNNGTSDGADTPGNGYIKDDTSSLTITSSNSDIIDLGVARNKSGNILIDGNSVKSDDMLLVHNISPDKWKGSNEKEEVNATVRYSIVERPQTSSSRYNDVGKVRTESYTVVPVDKVTDFTINTTKDKLKLGITTNVSNDPNGSFSGGEGSFNYVAGVNNANEVVTSGAFAGGDALEISTTGNMPNNGPNVNRVFITAKYKNLTLDVPFNYIRTTDDYTWHDDNKTVSGSGILVKNSSGKFNSKDETSSPKAGYITDIVGIREGAISWKDLYDVNSARYLRKDASVKLENPDGRIEDNWQIENNSNGEPKVSGAERGDSYTLTYCSKKSPTSKVVG